MWLMISRILATWSAAAALLCGAPKVVGGPVAVDVTARTATIVWVVQTDELTLHPPTGEAKKSPSLHVEKTTLTGLQPNTRYEYEAGGNGGVKGWFKTAPAPPANPATTVSAAVVPPPTPPPPVPFNFI